MTVRIITSDRFFYTILMIAVLQAVWYAFSFKPWINDEPHHMGVIMVYAHHVSPFLNVQNVAWDHLGDLTRNGSYMFYYVMSWPLRLLQGVTSSQTAWFIGLRLIGMAYFVGGLVLYRKALVEIKTLPRSIIHILLLLFVLTPAAGLLAGTVNYDNLVFLLFAGVMLLAVRIMRSRVLRADWLIGLLVVGLFMSLVKWTALALFVPAVLYVSYDILKKHGRMLWPRFVASARKLPRWQCWLLLAGMTVGLLLVAERPVLNTIRYGNPSPPCQVVLTPGRCSVFQNYAAHKALQANKPVDFRPYDPVRYLSVYWIPTMTDKASNLIERGRESDLPVIKALDYAAMYLWIVVVLVALRSILRSRYYRLLLVVLFGYAGVLLLREYAGYVTYGEPVAIRARYLVPVLPIALYIGAVASVDLFGRYKKSLLVCGALLVLVTLQGGSIVTHLFTAPQTAYWQNQQVRHGNQEIKRLLRPLVKQ